MLCSYFGKLLMGLRFRFCLFAWSTEEFGDINKSCTYRILSVSAMKKGVQEKVLCSFLLQACDLDSEVVRRKFKSGLCNFVKAGLLAYRIFCKKRLSPSDFGKSLFSRRKSNAMVALSL